MMHPEEIMQRMRRLAEAFKKQSPEEFQQLKKWFLHVLKGRIKEPLLQEKAAKIIEESTPWEVEKMISNLGLALSELEQQAEMRGVLKGIEKGRMEGRMEGKMEGELSRTQQLVCRYLQKKFGDVSLEAQQKIRGIDKLEILDSLAESLFDVSTWEEANAVICEKLDGFSRQ